MSALFAQTTRALRQDSPRLAHAVMAVSILALAAWSAWFLFGRVTVVEISKQARLETAAAPRDVTALQAGRLAATRLTIGRTVRAGEPLIELDAAVDALAAEEEQARLGAYPSKTDALRRQIAALEAALAADRRAAAAAVEAARARRQEAEAAADFAADLARRLRSQAAAGGVAEVEAARAAADARKSGAARDALAAETRRLELDAASRARQTQAGIEDLRRSLASLDADAEASRSAASRLKLQVERNVVRSPVDGVIAEALALGSGAYVAQGQKLATIVPNGRLIVVATFAPATALARVRPGQTARLRLDGYPWAQYGVVEADVLRVAGETRDNGLRVELSPRPGKVSDAILRHGLTGVVEVEVEKVSPAALLLRAAGQTAAGTRRS